jgi:integration host factor subunit beta
MATITKTITKKNLADRIAEKTGVKRVVVRRILQQLLDEIVEELGKGNRLEFRDFGVFELRERAARTAQNPKTMEKVQVPGKRTVKFKVGRLMKASLLDGNTAGAAYGDGPVGSARLAAGGGEFASTGGTMR